MLAGAATFGCAGTTLTPSADLQATRARQEEVLSEMRALRRQLEADQERRVDVDANVAMTLDDIESRLNHLENQVRDLIDGLARAKLSPSRGAAPPVPPPAGAALPAEEAYNAAYLEVTRSNYDLAIEGLEAFLRDYPNSEFADNAVYWVGECHYAKGEYDRAIEAFVRLMDSYPDGDKVPAAMLKLGYAFQERNDRAASRRYLEALTEQYPASEEAALAKERLANP